MTELYRLYTNAKQRDEDFLRRIVPLIQDDACIDTHPECADHAVYWKHEYDELDKLTRAHGIEILGQEGAPASYASADSTVMSPTCWPMPMMS